MTNITIERAKLEKWLATMDEATTYTSGFSSSPSITKECKDVCDEIKQALATQQEPVAWGNFKEDGTLVGLSQHPEDQKNWTNRKPLYTTPPAAPVPLTDENIDRIAYALTGFDGDGTQAMNIDDIRRIARAAARLTATPEKGQE